MRLTDNERQDAIKFIQEGNLLPEKYWFLLFDDDREVELVSAEKEVSRGRRKVAVKVVDIFGNDTTRVIEVNV